jgi:pyridoxamine 5'-phosphate oxidase
VDKLLVYWGLDANFVWTIFAILTNDSNLRKFYAANEDVVLAIHHLRRDYLFGSLSLTDLPSDPWQLFESWFKQLQEAELPSWFELNAMTLSTSTEGNTTTRIAGAQNTVGVSSRVVLLKHVDLGGFTFFTNYESEKGQQISLQPRVALHFFWPIFDRQVRVEGLAVKTSAEVSDAYFAARPRSSQLGAIASPQSRPIDDETKLEQAVRDLELQFEGKSIPRPENWGGYCVIPNMFEFWQGKPSRLHDRFQYRKNESTSSWSVTRLAP